MPPHGNSSRGVDYDDYDVDYEDDYSEEEAVDGGMTEDDKEQMRVGTQRVREELGEFEAGVSDAQIQDSLWHYYYDVAKSVSFLKNKLGGVQAPKEQPKKEKTASKFDQAASQADLKAPIPAGEYTYT
jgi:elongation factor 1 alpha-like protein